MQQIFSLGMSHQQKYTSKDKEQPMKVQQQLFSIYETRLKSIMETFKIYQENLERDNETGALAFMKSQEMATYRVDREYELLKDVLLTQKQRLVIKVLTSYHQIKKQNEQLKSQSSSNFSKSPFTKSQQQMAAQKDVLINNNFTSLDKESRISNKIGQMYSTNSNNQFSNNKNSNSRVSIISQANEMNTSASISVYERLLQEKLALIKDFQKKNRHLTNENQQYSHKIAQLQANLQKSLKQEMTKKQCLQCLTLNQLHCGLTKKHQNLTKQHQLTQLKLKQQHCLKKATQDQLYLKQLKLHELSMKLQTLQRQNQLRTQHQQQQKLTKPNPQSNLNTIKQLKDKLLVQDEQLMLVNNSFNFMKEDIADSLYAQIRRLKNSHHLLKENVKSYITTLKKYIFINVTEIITAVTLKTQANKARDQIAKKIRQIDNQLDYFIQQKHIKI